MSDNKAIVEFNEVWEASPKEILLLREQGMTIVQIAKHLDKTRQTCYNRLRMELEGINEWFNNNQDWIKKSLLSGCFLDKEKAQDTLQTYSETYPIKAYRLICHLISLFSHPSWQYIEALDVICYSERDLQAAILELGQKYGSFEDKSKTKYTYMKELAKAFKGFNFSLSEIEAYLARFRYSVKGDYFVCPEFFRENALDQKLFLTLAIKWFYKEKRFDINDDTFIKEMRRIMKSRFDFEAPFKKSLLNSLRYITVKDTDGKYHLPELDRAYVDVLDDVYKYVSEMKQPFISYNDLYVLFKDRLSSSPIKSSLSLHDNLRIYLPDSYKDSFVLKKEYILKKTDDGSNDSIYDGINDYIASAGRPVPVEELISQFGEAHARRFVVNYKQYPFGETLFQGGDGFIYLPDIELSERELRRFFHLTEMFMENKYGTASIFSIYKVYGDCFPKFFPQMSITSPRLLFYILKKNFPDYHYHYPYISKEAEGSSLSYRVVKDAIYKEMPVIFSMEELTSYLFELFPFSEDLESTGPSYRAYKHIRKIMADEGITIQRGRSSHFLYTTVSKLGITADKEQSIKETVIRYIKDDTLSPTALQTIIKKLPVVETEWSKPLIRAVIRFYYPNIKFI